MSFLREVLNLALGDMKCLATLSTAKKIHWVVRLIIKENSMDTDIIEPLNATLRYT